MKRPRTKMNKEEIAEDFCFICKDGGHLRVCDFGDCLKAYHPDCLGKEPSFLNSDETWSCDWHSCFICKGRSKIQCFCCTKAVCLTCIKDAEFVQVKTMSRGICINCLDLALLIETNADMAPDGEKVNFEDTETYEFLFKDYWEIIKNCEKLSLKDLCSAKAAMDSGQHFTVDADSDKFSDEDVPSDITPGGSYGEEFLVHEEYSRKSFRLKTPKSFQPKKRTFIGWGSEELISFLISIGLDTSEPYTQHDISEIIKRYVYENNLLHPVKKKKKVVCDERLLALFRKKTVKLFKIHNLLESHFAANDGSDDDLHMGFEEENVMNSKKKPRKDSYGEKTDRKTCDSTNFDSPSPPKSCYASFVEENIKLIYLRRSLVQDLLKNPDDLESKMVGSIVRVKTDPKDFFNSPSRIYILGQVTSIKKAKETYKVGDICTDVVLRISTTWKDVRISMLSEDDFEEDECEHLCHLVKKGLHQRPLVAEFQKKAASLHKDIMIHWINREIALLGKQIDRANEKGWRRELFNLIERKELLSSPAEQERLLKVVPEVIPDEILDETSLGSKVCSEGRIEENKLPEQSAEQKAPLSGISEVGVHSDVTNQKYFFCRGPTEERQEISWMPVKQIQYLGAAESILSDKVVEKEKEQSNDFRMGENAKAPPILDIDLNHTHADQTCPSKIEVIDLDDDEDENDCNPVANGSNEESDNKTNIRSGRDAMDGAGWHYLDPAGNVQGPFAVDLLRWWHGKGFFSDDFKIWRHGHSQSEAILLLDAFRLHR